MTDYQPPALTGHVVKFLGYFMVEHHERLEVAAADTDFPLIVAATKDERLDNHDWWNGYVMAYTRDLWRETETLMIRYRELEKKEEAQE